MRRAGCSAGDALVDEAGVRLSRHQGGVAAAIRRGAFKGVETQAGHPFLAVLAVARKQFSDRMGRTSRS